MKRLITILVILAVLVSSALTANAADGMVVYSGNAGEFVFAPGTEHALTDLFPNFKGVMPGDTLAQKITVKNDASNKVKVKIFIRSLGAQEASAEFLSQLGLKVQKSDENEMAYMFDAAANETAQLTDWVCLGTLYSGGEVDLDVILTVPVELDNKFQNSIGYWNWEFRIEEFPIQPDDPIPPQTGDTTKLGLLIGGLIASGSALFILLVTKKKSRQ